MFILSLPAVITATGSEVVIQGDMRASNITPTFDHGYLATYEQGGVAVYAPDGSLATRIVRPSEGNIVNADVDSDGSVTVAFHQSGRGWRTGGISIYNRDGSPLSEIKTNPYQPSQVCFGPDHTVWALVDEDPGSPGAGSDFYLLHHYARDGSPLGEFLPRSSFPAGVHPGQIMVGLWRLRIVNGRIGAALNQAGENKRLLWLEADLNGNETGRWTTPLGAMPVAMTEGGAVYAQGMGEISVLDRVSGSWKPVPRSFNDRLLGAEGNTLVFAVKGMNAIRMAAQP